MSTIRTAIELQDNFTSVLYGIVGSVNSTVTAMEEMQQTMNSSVDMTSLQEAREQANQAATAVSALDAAVQSLNAAPVVSVPEMKTIPVENIQEEINKTIESANKLDTVLKNFDSSSVSPNLDQINFKSNETIQAHAVVTNIDFPENIQFFAEAVVSNVVSSENQQMDDLTVQITPNITEQPEIDLPDKIDIPIHFEAASALDDGIMQDYKRDVNLAEASLVDLREAQVAIAEQSGRMAVVPENLQTQINAVELGINDLGHSISALYKNQSDQELININSGEMQQKISEIKNSIIQLTSSQSQLNEELQKMENANSPPELNTGNVQQYQNEINHVAELLQRVSAIQENIDIQGKSINVIPDDIQEQVAVINKSIEQMEQSLNTIRESSLEFDIDAAQLQLINLNGTIIDTLNKQSQLNESMQQLEGQGVDVPVKPVTPDPLVDNPAPVEIPITWNNETLDIFTGTGIERFQQEVQSTNSMLDILNSTQKQIAATASKTNLLPANAINDINGMQSRIQTIQQQIQTIENNPINLGTDTANTELEQLRGQLDKAIQEQQQLNSAIEKMDVSGANEAYLRLSDTIGNTERYIRDNTTEQGQFNHAIEQGTNDAGQLMSTIKRVAAAYISMQGIGKIIDLSDTMTQTTARLDLIVDDGGSVEELQDKIYASSQNARGSYMATADAVSKLGMQASQAFSSNDELIAFTELLNKQFVNAGTHAQGVESVMLQLTQSMAAGKLQGEELNAVLDNAAPIVQNIQQYLEEVQGIDASNIKELASEGALTSDIIKNSMFYAADEINAKFESMPMTFSQIWTSFKNTALMAFQPVLEQINMIANSESFQTFVESATNALASVAGFVTKVFGVVVSVAGFIAKNWSIISPIIYGVATAFAILGTYIVIVKLVSIAYAAVQAVVNAILAANPIMLVVGAIIVLIAIIFAVCTAIAKFTGIANSGFGVICGGVNVVIQFFKNLGLSVANIALGIGHAIGALCSNMMTAFHNAICSVQSWFYELLSTGLTVIEGICKALNKLPFVEFDYSGITSAADDYAAKAAEAAGNKEEYESIGDAFKEGLNTFDVFQDGWISDAFNSGAKWGDGVTDKISNLLDGFGDIPNMDDYSNNNYSAFGSDFGGAGSGLDDIGGGVDNIANNTGDIADSMDITEEELKYLRDIAEQETINRFTTAEIKIEQINNNNISSDADLDGIITNLTNAVDEAVSVTAKGVHT